MNKQLCHIVFFFLVFSVSAQMKYVDYRYLKEQRSPFNGVFLEPRYHDVDSIVAVTYGYYFYACFPYPEKLESEVNILPSFEDPPSGYTYYNEMHTSLKTSEDGLVDTFVIYGRDCDAEPHVLLSVKRYSIDDQLIYVNDSNKFIKHETHYTYDPDGRIYTEQEVNIRCINADTIKGVRSVKYDYENRIIYSGVSKTYFKYTDNGYITIDTFYTHESIPGGSSDDVRHVEIKEYIFDSDNRLQTIEIEHTQSSAVFFPIPLVSMNKYEYKYTVSGYEEYYNDIIRHKVTFQEDGYCTEMVLYDSSGEYINEISNIERFVYFKNGREVSNMRFKTIIPKAYGIPGGIMIDLADVAIVNIYSFTGGLVKRENVGEGNTVITLPKGIYIVVIGDLSYKVLVR